MKKIFYLIWAPLLFFAVTVSAQNKPVSGKVINAKTGSPLQGITVTVKGTSEATQTDANGTYSVNAPANATLTFSAVNFNTQDIRLGTSSTVNAGLTESAKELNEVIVTAQSVKREARSLGYSTTTISNQELTKGKERSVLNALQGKVAGVQITGSSGGVGSSTRIVFRGGTSITGNNQALIVVDGIPIDNSQADAGDNLNNQVDAGNRGNDINPEDVESVTVLKGAAAAALYGSRASNGALIITTKNGKLRGKKSEVILSSAYSFESILRLPSYQNEYGQGGKKQVDLRENFSWGPKYDGTLQPWGQVVDGEQRVKPYSAIPRNIKEFFDIGGTLNNNVSLSQNNDKTTYYVSFNSIDQKGVMPGTKYKRNSVKLSGTTEMAHNIYSSASINYIRSNGDLSIQGQGSSPYDQVLQTPRDIPLLELRDYNNKFNNLSGYYGAYTINPWYLLGENSYTNTVERVLGNMQIGIKPVPWLDISYRIGTDVSTDKRKQAVAKRVVSDPNNQNFGANFDGTYGESTLDVREFTSDLIINANKKVSENFTISGLVGHNIRQRSVNLQTSAINSLVIPKIYNLSNSDAPPVSTNNYNLRRLYGVYGSLSLAYKNYLFLDLTGRNDWSSTLPKNKNSFFYPSASASFVFTEGFNLPQGITYGKLRVGAAQVGNDARPYSLQSVFVSGNITDGTANSVLNFPFNGVPGFTQSGIIGNPALKPEITTSYEVGLEFSILKNRLGFDATVYNNESRNQIITVPIPTTSGYTSQTLNAGSITNKGIEILLRGQPVKSRNFTWDVSITFTKNENRVKELFPGVQQITIPGGFVGGSVVAQIGEPYGAFFGTGFRRDPQGRVVVDGNTGYPLVEPVAKIYGNVQADFLAGISNTFSYKGFNLSALFDTRQGGVFFSRTRTLQEFTGTDPRTLLNDREAFVVPNSVIEETPGKFVPNTSVKVLDAQDYWTNFSSPTAMEQLVDASFIKLREVTLSYSLPKKWLEKLSMSNLQVGLTGRNLAIWTPKSNTYSDPETSSFGTGNAQGFEYGTIPNVRSYGANVRITF